MLTNEQAAVLKAARRLVATWPSTRALNAEEHALGLAVRALPLIRAAENDIMRLRPGGIVEAEGKGLATIKQTHLKQRCFWAALANGDDVIIRFDEIERVIAFKAAPATAKPGEVLL